MWVDEIPMVGSDGSTNVPFSLFLISFTFVVPWVVLQLTTIVLLDSYIKASRAHALHPALLAIHASGWFMFQARHHCGYLRCVVAARAD